MPTAPDTPPLDATTLDAPTLDWLGRAGHVPVAVEPLAGDVSPRRYYRLRVAGAGSLVLATYPAEDVDGCRRFLAASTLLEAVGVPVPEILAADIPAGRMLLVDLGDETLYARRGRGWDYLSPRLERAAAFLAAIEALATEAVAALNPPLDGPLLGRELEKTWTLALGAPSLVESDLVGARDGALDAALATMIDRLDGGRRVPCHRDYMARNLMPVERAAADETLYVIDHQDLRLGPRGYDLASLLNDSLFAPEALEASLLERFAPTAEERLGYHRAAAQRSLKVVGTYLGFADRGAPRHLGLVEPSLRRAVRHLALLPELEGLSAAVEELAGALLEAAHRRDA